MRYLLDTDTATDVYDFTATAHDRLRERIQRLPNKDEVFISILTHCELEYGYDNAADTVKPKIRKQIDAILRDFAVIPVQGNVALHYGYLKSALKELRGISRANIKRHNIDILLAATALEESCVLVSRDSIFQLLADITPRLQLENWQ
jgi:predicted nucleic acid-binding protein